MSFQAYLDNIKTKTGKSPEEFKKLAEKNGLLNEGVKAGEIIAWLKKDFDLGHGHAMAIYTVFKGTKETKEPLDKALARHFTGRKSAWQAVFESLMNAIREFGDDINLSPASSYISVLRGGKKIAVVQIMVAHIDIGIKLKGVQANKRFAEAGSWNAMMTHRVRITNKKQIDKGLMSWLRSAYEQNARAK